MGLLFRGSPGRHTAQPGVSGPQGSRAGGQQWSRAPPPSGLGSLLSAWPRVLTLPLPLASELRHPAGAEQPCGESPPLREPLSRHPCGRKCLQRGAGILVPGGGLVPSLLKPTGSPSDLPVWLLTHPTRSTSPPGDGWKSLMEMTPTAKDEATWQNGRSEAGGASDAPTWYSARSDAVKAVGVAALSTYVGRVIRTAPITS